VVPHVGQRRPDDGALHHRGRCWDCGRHGILFDLSWQFLIACV
jgi:hypothetical protein